MIRSLLFAIGIFLLIFGAQTFMVDKWIMAYERPVAAKQELPSQVVNNRRNPFRIAGFSNRTASRNYYDKPATANNSFKPVFQTQEWMPWSLLAAGTIIVLYTFSTGRSSDS